MLTGNSLNGLSITSRLKTTLYIPLPLECQAPIAGPRCVCPYCKAHPEHVPAWDTLAIPLIHGETTWTVHCPDRDQLARMSVTPTQASTSADHRALCHPNGEPCPDGCDARPTR